MFSARLKNLISLMNDNNIDVAVITDEDNIYYLTGYYDYLHLDFGRPTLLVVQRDGSSLLITPQMEAAMAKQAAQVDKISFWNDGAGDGWRTDLPIFIRNGSAIAIETLSMPQVVQKYLSSLLDLKTFKDISPILASMRMIKSQEELQLARHAGEIASAMMVAGRESIADGIPEFEVALATTQAGTRKAAEILTAHYEDSCMSPNTHFLQIMASGKEIIKPHHRASTKIMKIGEPVFLCFCGMTNFHRFKLGFDRTFWIGEIPNPRHAEVYEVAVESQRAALEVLGPGIKAEDVHAAYSQVIKDAGFDYPFRCGRATGYSFLENPQLVTGDKTILAPGMVLAVDGSVTLEGEFRAQVGDSFIITNNGYEQITHHSKATEDIILS